MSSESPVLAPPETPLRFDVAHPNAPTKETTCSICARQISEEYYEVEGKVACAGCQSELNVAASGKSTSAQFARALGLGALGAIGAAAAYGILKVATDRDWVLGAIVVGFIVGKGVYVGSSRRGGRRYQLLALALTYLALALSNVPSVVQLMRETRALQSESRHESSPPNAQPAQRSRAKPRPSEPVAETSVSGPMSDSSDSKRITAGEVLIMIVVLPLLVGFQSIFSLVGVVVALIQAWRQNRATRIRITGPYRIAGTPMMEPTAT